MTAQLAISDFGDDLTAPDSVRRLVKRAAVQEKIEVLRGNLVVASTESLGGSRNIEWVQKIVAEASATIEPGLFVVVVGEREATWDTTWSAVEDKDGSKKLDNRYESFGSRMQAFGFEALRVALGAVKDAGKELRDQGLAYSTAQKKLAKAYAEVANESPDVAIERMKHEQETERIETAGDLFKQFGFANSQVVGSAKRTEALKEKAKLGIPGIVDDILSKLPEADKTALLATDVGKTFEAAKTTADLVGAVRAVHALVENGELVVTEETKTGIGNVLRKLAGAK